MTKRNLWKHDETMALLSIIEEKRFLELVEEKKYKPYEIFEMMEKEMFLKGFFEKTGKQMECRWKNLKKQYFSEKRAQETGTTSDAKINTIYFNEIDHIFTSRTRDFKNEVMNKILDETAEVSCSKPTASQSSEEDDDDVLENTEMPAFEECFPALPSVEPAPKRKCVTNLSATNIDMFHDRIKRVTKELNHDLFQKQKELVEYEYKLFTNFAHVRDEKFKRMMESNTNMFLSGIKDLLEKRNEDDDITEDLMIETTKPETASSFYHSWNQTNNKQ